MNRPYSRPLDYEIDYITIGTLRKDDVGDIVVLHSSKEPPAKWASVSIFEDMFMNFMACEITLFDQNGGFLNVLRTEEVIAIKFRTPDLAGRSFEPRTHYFYLYKIQPVSMLDKVGGAMYTIRGISFEYFYNALRTFSKSYKGKTTEIAEQIYKEFLEAKSQRTMKKSFTVGRPTKHEMKFTFPYVNPVDAINHLASVSVDSVNPNICNYVFFENKDGYNFKSITEMIETPRRVHKYQTSNTMNGKEYTDYEAHFDKTISVIPKKTGDKIIDTLDGVWGEYFADYDMLYKSYKPFFAPVRRGSGGDAWGKRYLDYFPKTKHLNPKALLSNQNEVFKYPLGRNRICFSNKALFSEEKTLENGQKEYQLFQTHEEEYSFQRRSMMQQINGFRVEVTVPGNSDITVGDIFELDTIIYRVEGKDKYLSGRYLVTGVHHVFSLKEYQTIVTISRDSLVSDDFDEEVDFEG